MKIVYSWLKDFVAIDVPVEEAAEALTSCGLEVASIEYRRSPEGIVAARVIETENHPKADRLKVCKVDTGANEPLTIVCGAPNVTAGMYVACATVGTKIDDSFTIKKAKIRGVESFGMLCSEKELGISDDHSGLMSLSETVTPGTPFSEYYPDDAVIEIELTPDRGDCLSVIGVAREIAARFDLPLKSTVKLPNENSSDPIDAAITVTIDSPDCCPRYMGRLVRNVTIKPSPQWLQRRLSLAGFRPINNVVDITNYILLHFGQPMHAFDYQHIEGRSICVTTAGNSQSFTTLDGVDRSLEPDDLLITDENRPIALAGIMGGAGSEITDQTKDVFLECAYFEPIGIRKTGKRLNLSSDSSYRFERGVDPDGGLIAALDTAAALLEQLADGDVAQGKIDSYPQPLSRKTIAVHPSKVSRVLGVPLSAERITTFLTSLQFECSPEKNDEILCTVPLFRHDITIEEDCIEEVGRCYGYDNIPTSEIMQLSLHQSLPEVERITDTIRSALAFTGMNEVITNSMTSEKKRVLITPDKKPVELLNPLNPEMAQMRTTLLGSMLDVTAYNCNRKNNNNRFFEIGKIFEVLSSGEPQERTILAILLEGNYWEATWNNPAQPATIYILKSILENLGSYLGIGNCSFSNSSMLPHYLTKTAAAVTIGSSVNGFAGEVTSAITTAFEIKSTVYYCELDITHFLTQTLPLHSYKSLPRYPALERDFCFVMDEEVTTSAITDTISSLSPLVERIYPFDVYRGDKLGNGKKSITFSTRFRSAEKTLTDKDVEQLCTQIIQTAAHRFNAQLRT